MQQREAERPEQQATHGQCHPVVDPEPSHPPQTWQPPSSARWRWATPTLAASRAGSWRSAYGWWSASKAEERGTGFCSFEKSREAGVERRWGYARATAGSSKGAHGRPQQDPQAGKKARGRVLLGDASTPLIPGGHVHPVLSQSARSSGLPMMQAAESQRTAGMVPTFSSSRFPPSAFLHHGWASTCRQGEGRGAPRAPRWPRNPQRLSHKHKHMSKEPLAGAPLTDSIPLSHSGAGPTANLPGPTGHPARHPLTAGPQALTCGMVSRERGSTTSRFLMRSFASSLTAVHTSSLKLKLPLLQQSAGGGGGAGGGSGGRGERRAPAGAPAPAAPASICCAVLC